MWCYDTNKNDNEEDVKEMIFKVRGQKSEVGGQATDNGKWKRGNRAWSPGQQTEFNTRIHDLGSWMFD